MKSQMTFGRKITLVFSAMLALLLALAYFALSSIGSLGNALDVQINKTNKITELAGTISTDAYQMRTGQRGVIMYSLLVNPSKTDENKELFRSSAEALHQALIEIQPLLRKPAARQAVENIGKGLIAWQPFYQKLVDQCAAMQFDAAFNQASDNARLVNEQIIKDAQRVLQAQHETQAEAAQSAARSISTGRWIAFLLIGLALAAGATALWTVRTVSAQLCNLAAELGSSAHQLAGAASQVSCSSQSLAQGSSQQAASLEETSASSEEVSSMARKNTENSRCAADLVTSSQQKFSSASQSLEQSVVAMAEINAQSGKISKIIKVIEEIAFQTNILALNAAVEAARAGEAGMGFAVVADEVRNLAQRCSQAAKDTASLIEESISKSDDGKSKVDLVAAAIRAIIAQSTQVKTLVEELNMSSQEQSRGIELVAKSITQMEQVTQTTAANAEESAAAAEELTAQSEVLKDIVAQLSVMVGADAVRRRA